MARTRRGALLTRAAINDETWVTLATAARILFGDSNPTQCQRVRRLVERQLLRARRLCERGWIQISLEDLYRFKQENSL